MRILVRHDAWWRGAYKCSGGIRLAARINLECFGERTSRPLLYAARGASGGGGIVAVTPPEPVAQFLAERDYLPRRVPLLKHVLALPGQTVCRIRLAIMIDGS